MLCLAHWRAPKTKYALGRLVPPADLQTSNILAFVGDDRRYVAAANIRRRP
jgi:hypothetical protein